MSGENWSKTLQPSGICNSHSRSSEIKHPKHDINLVLKFNCRCNCFCDCNRHCLSLSFVTLSHVSLSLFKRIKCHKSFESLFEAFSKWSCYLSCLCLCLCFRHPCQSFSSSAYCPLLNVLHILWGIQPLSGLATFNLHIIIIFMLNIPSKAKIFNSALNQAVFVSLEQFPRICFVIEFLDTFSFGYIMTLVLMDCRIPQSPAVSNSAPLENAHANQISVSFQCPSMWSTPKKILVRLAL